MGRRGERLSRERSEGTVAGEEICIWRTADGSAEAGSIASQCGTSGAEQKHRDYGESAYVDQAQEETMAHAEAPPSVPSTTGQSLGVTESVGSPRFSATDPQAPATP